jgi:hypothetical protein
MGYVVRLTRMLHGAPRTRRCRCCQVKTQRALNDYRKSEWPHYRDELTKLKFIGSITAQRLRDIQGHLGCDVPFTSIETGAPSATYPPLCCATARGTCVRVERPLFTWFKCLPGAATVCTHASKQRQARMAGIVRPCKLCHWHSISALSTTSRKLPVAALFKAEYLAGPGPGVWRDGMVVPFSGSHGWGK